MWGARSVRIGVPDDFDRPLRSSTMPRSSRSYHREERVHTSPRRGSPKRSSPRRAKSRDRHYEERVRVSHRGDDLRRSNSFDRLERNVRGGSGRSHRDDMRRADSLGRVDSVGGSDVYDYVSSSKRRSGGGGMSGMSMSGMNGMGGKSGSSGMRSGYSQGYPSQERFDREYYSMPRSRNPKVVKYPKGEFLREVQEELESRRSEWKGEVEKMIEGMTIKNMYENASRKNGYGDTLNGTVGSTPNSYVDTSTGTPMFKAFVDVSDYPLQSVNLTVDKLENKLVVTAKKPDVPGRPSNTFKQKVALPRFADDQRIKTKLNKRGILTVEVPLMYYFEPEKKKAKSFINQIKRNSDGTKSVEILVNIGHDIKPWEVKVGVNKEGELLIRTEKETMLSNGDTKKTRQLIKRYILPEGADVKRISSNMGKDGRLSVNVPVMRGFMLD